MELKEGRVYITRDAGLTCQVSKNKFFWICGDGYIDSHAKGEFKETRVIDTGMNLQEFMNMLLEVFKNESPF